MSKFFDKRGFAEFLGIKPARPFRAIPRLSPMATWEDGPEYAPLARPDEFSAPETAPLDVAPPYATTVQDAPDDRPDFGSPEAAIPLATLSAAPSEESRDPGTPFAVATAAITEESTAWSAAHWSPPSGPPVAPGEVSPVGPWGPPTGAPAGPSGPIGLGTGQRQVTGPSPDQPIRLSGSDRNTTAAALPQAGSVEWFGPGPTPPAPAASPVTLSLFVTALSPVVLIFLLIGGLVQPMAAVAFIVAFACSALVKVSRPLVRRVFLVAAITIALITLIGLLLPNTDFFGVLNLMSQVTSWCVLLISSTLVFLSLRRGERPQQQKVVWG